MTLKQFTSLDILPYQWFENQIGKEVFCYFLQGDWDSNTITPGYYKTRLEGSAKVHFFSQMARGLRYTPVE